MDIIIQTVCETSASTTTCLYEYATSTTPLFESAITTFEMVTGYFVGIVTMGFVIFLLTKFKS